jgi:predicted nucleic acid-binding protein
MAANCLADTGAILAYLDRHDPWHQLCRDAFSQLRLPLLTSTAVLTEVFHLIQARRVEQAVVWRFIRSGAIFPGTIGADDFPNLQELMLRYADRPMDFADASLVRLAQRESITRIFTVDQADFETYRIDGRRRFTVIPATRP